MKKASSSLIVVFWHSFFNDYEHIIIQSNLNKFSLQFIGWSTCSSGQDCWAHPLSTSKRLDMALLLSGLHGRKGGLSGDKTSNAK